MTRPIPLFLFFFFNDTATTEIYTLSLHDALPISTPASRDDARTCAIRARDFARDASRIRNHSRDRARDSPARRTHPRRRAEVLRAYRRTSFECVRGCRAARPPRPLFPSLLSTTKG